MTPREAILTALADLLVSPAAGGFFPPAAIDEPEPSGWVAVGGAPGMLHAAAVQDGPPPERLAYVRGADDTDELELEAVVAYAVQRPVAASETMAVARSARRARRDQAVERLAALIAANRTLGLGAEVWAELGPAQRDDEVAFANAVAAAVAVIPVRVLYTASHAAG